MTTSQIEAENTQMTNDLYRLLKKYTGLRNLIRGLKVRYQTWLILTGDIIQRYILLIEVFYISICFMYLLFNTNNNLVIDSIWGESKIEKWQH